MDQAKVFPITIPRQGEEEYKERNHLISLGKYGIPMNLDHFNNEKVGKYTTMFIPWIFPTRFYALFEHVN